MNCGWVFFSDSYFEENGQWTTLGQIHAKTKWATVYARLLLVCRKRVNACPSVATNLFWKFDRDTTRPQLCWSCFRLVNINILNSLNIMLNPNECRSPIFSIHCFLQCFWGEADQTEWDDQAPGLLNLWPGLFAEQTFSWTKKSQLIGIANSPKSVFCEPTS